MRGFFKPIGDCKQSGVLLRNMLLSSAIFSLSSLSSAELKLLSEESLGKVVGKAGLTIDIETQVTIGEFEYVDAGSMYWKNISLQGIGGGLVDNIRATIDSTNGAESLKVGFADAAFLASRGYLDPTETDVAWAMTEYDDGAGGFGKTFEDGDLVIHIASTDFGLDFSVASNPANHAANLQAMKNAVDFHYQEGEFGLRSSDGSVETALTRNFSVQAYLGYLDIIFKNKGNGFHTTTGVGEPSGIQLGDSYIQVDARFRVEDLDVDSTNNATNTFIPRAVTNPYLTLRNMRIHNERGNDTLGSFGFASLEGKSGAASGILNIGNGGSITRVDGHAFYDINVKWDWDLPHISFGDTNVSIGEVYFTDFHIIDTSVVMSAH